MVFSDWNSLLYDLFVVDTFGTPLMFSFGLLFLFAYMGFKFRMSFDAMSISLLTLILVLSGFGWLPTWIIGVVVIIFGLLIGKAILKIGRR